MEAKQGVKVELNKKVASELIDEIHPDEVAIAIGVVTQVPLLPDINGKGVVVAEVAEFYLIGNAKEPRIALNAIDKGFQITRTK